MCPYVTPFSLWGSVEVVEDGQRRSPLQDPGSWTWIWKGSSSHNTRSSPRNMCWPTGFSGCVKTTQAEAAQTRPLFFRRRCFCLSCCLHTFIYITNCKLVRVFLAMTCMFCKSALCKLCMTSFVHSCGFIFMSWFMKSFITNGNDVWFLWQLRALRNSKMQMSNHGPRSLSGSKAITKQIRWTMLFCKAADECTMNCLSA